MAIQKFEDVLVWQKAQDISVKIYRYFSSSKDNGFRDQITRASVSISNNIAKVLIEVVMPILKDFSILRLLRTVK